MSARKKSSVWTFYTETDQPNKVKCILCDSLISRGGSGRSASTSALTNHLRVKHDREYTQLQHPIHLPNPILPSTPNMEQKWNEIKTGFELKWNFPGCIGAIDGKHVIMRAPVNSESDFNNYKKTHSI
ncbi:unnamed protein product [Euphydryas editha]|uniref:BED-type domain-containing protein n=1 Tax=Euphydryas editha TaxID=104508 RepID=A0AAU9TS30_EUPED|nr:unnamed protein product [Euphydryas editha]